MSDESRILAGILLLSLVTVETGGLYLLQLVRGKAPATAFQERFARAGHAHAAVLLMLALICQLLRTPPHSRACGTGFPVRARPPQRC